MDISMYLLPELDRLHPRSSRDYDRRFANHYDIARMERDAAEATGVSYYRIMESSTLDILPDEWRVALQTAVAHNAAIDNPRATAEEQEAVTLMRQSEWSRATWKRLHDLGYANFSADEATVDGAYWNTSYSLSGRGTELAAQHGIEL